MQSIGIPEDILPTISQELLAFLWKKKTNIFFNFFFKAFEKVKRKVFVQDFKKGGLKMIDMKKDKKEQQQPRDTLANMGTENDRKKEDSV